MMHWRMMVQDAESLPTEQSELTAARIRTIISRCYYAAYHACLEYAERQGYVWVRGAGGVHEQLLRFLTVKPRSSDYRLGKQLTQLRDRRVTADYDRTSRLTRHDAEDALDMMSDIVNALPASSN